MSLLVMGGADGPTAVFFVTRPGGGDFPWFTIFGLITVFLLYIPEIVRHFRHKEMNLCESRLMNFADRIGILVSLLMTIWWVGYGDVGFSSVGALLCYVYGNLLLILVNCILWLIHHFVSSGFRLTSVSKPDGPTAVFVAGKKQVRAVKALRIATAAVPSLVFLLDGLTLRIWILVGSALVYGVGHICVTIENLNINTGKNVKNG